MLDTGEQGTSGDGETEAFSVETKRGILRAYENPRRTGIRLKVHLL